MKEKKNGHLIPVFSLLVLAPVLGELVSGSAPPAEFFQPIGLMILTALYGCGAVFIRELVRKWDKGWISVMLLGMAYGIFEEGVVIRSFFDPTWMDLGLLATYGRWAGVNWIWSVGLTVYHAVISISIPIILVELIFPKVREERWLGKTGFVLAGIIFFAVSLLGPVFGMKVTILGMVLSILSILIFGFAAYKIPKDLSNNKETDPKKPILIYLVSLVLMTGLVFGMYGMPALNLSPIITFAFLGALPWLGIGTYQYFGWSGWKEIHYWSCMFGLITPWLFLGIVSELDNVNRPDNTSGMILVTLLTLFFIDLLGLVITKRKKSKKQISNK